MNEAQKNGGIRPTKKDKGNKNTTLGTSGKVAAPHKKYKIDEIGLQTAEGLIQAVDRAKANDLWFKKAKKLLFFL